MEEKEIRLAGAKLSMAIILREHTVSIRINQGVEVYPYFYK